MACVAVVDESGVERDADINVESAPLVISSEYWVAAGQNSVPMTPVASSVCFLTGISGSFDNANGWLSAVGTGELGGGTTNWYLGSNPQGDRKAFARCLLGVSPSQRTGPHTWDQGDAALDIGSSSNRICLLTAVQGKYNGNGEQARVRISDGRWILDGTSGTSENYMITSQAYCVLGVSSTERSGEYSVIAPAGGSTSVTTEYEYAEDSAFCALTRVQGKFNSPFDSMYTTAGGFPPQPFWWVGAGSDSSTVRGGARCIHKDAF
jgi:hypothetical protein